MLQLQLRRLDLFCTVVDEGGVTRAAERLHVAQPWVSAQLRTLEKAAGAPLFVRDGRRLALTEAGRRFHSWAADVLAGSAQVRRDIENLGAGLAGSLTVETSMAIGTVMRTAAPRTSRRAAGRSRPRRPTARRCTAASRTAKCSDAGCRRRRPACLEAVVNYSVSRVQFGKPIGSFQIQQQKLASMIVEVHRALLLALHLGRLKDAGRLAPEQVSLGKLGNVDAALSVARTPRQILGANAISLEYPVMRHMTNL
jgi:hypothetical protein